MAKKKKKNIRSIVTTVIVFAVLIGGITTAYILFHRANDTKFNESPNANGNTPGNLYNSGLYAELDGKVYFSNPLDMGRLYVMDSNGKNLKKLSQDTVFSINAYGSYLYYAKNDIETNDSTSIFRGTYLGAYRSNLDGKKVMALYDDYAQTVVLVGNTVYMQCYDNDRDKETTTCNIKSISINGGKAQEYLKNGIDIAGTYGSHIYYIGNDNDHNIYSMNTANKNSSTILEGNCWMPIVSGNQLYYLDLSDNYSLVKTSVGNAQSGTVLVDERISTYNVSDTYIYFQIDDKENSKLCRIRKDAGTNEYEVVAKGNYENINITSTYVYFHDFNNESITYRTPVNGPVHVQELSTVLEMPEEK